MMIKGGFRIERQGEREQAEGRIDGSAEGITGRRSPGRVLPRAAFIARRKGRQTTFTLFTYALSPLATGLS